MKLSRHQQSRFWREWSAACQRMGWLKELGVSEGDIENQRYALLERAGFDSLTKVDHLAGYDRVLAELSALNHPDSIDAQLRQERMPRTRLIYAINTLCREFSIVAGYEVLHPYAEHIMQDRWGHTDPDRLSLPELEQLRNTIQARVTAHKARQRETNPF